MRELRLPIRPQIFIAEAFHNLKILFEARDHQDLFEQLRRLGQCIEIAVMEAARHQVISRAFGCRFGQDGCLDLPESLAVHIITHGHRDAMPHAKRFLHLGPAQVEVAVFQAKVLGSCDFVFDRKRGGFRFAQNPELACDYLDFARFQIRILQTLVPHPDFAAGGNDKLGPQRFGGSMQIGVIFGIEYDLSDTLAVAQIDK